MFSPSTASRNVFNNNNAFNSNVVKSNLPRSSISEKFTENKGNENNNNERRIVLMIMIPYLVVIAHCGEHLQF